MTAGWPRIRVRVVHSVMPGKGHLLLGVGGPLTPSRDKNFSFHLPDNWEHIWMQLIRNTVAFVGSNDN